jgi:hypothetical protein
MSTEEEKPPLTIQEELIAMGVPPLPVVSDEERRRNYAEWRERINESLYGKDEADK